MGVMVMVKKIGQNFKVFVVKWSEILSMTMAKIQIFYGQYIHLTISNGFIVGNG